MAGTDADAIKPSFLDSLDRSDSDTYPFRHWLLDRILPEETCAAIDRPETLVTILPYQRNSGLVFIPTADSWHGFHSRPILGVRRSLIVNYETGMAFAP